MSIHTFKIKDSGYTFTGEYEYLEPYNGGTDSPSYDAQIVIISIFIDGNENDAFEIISTRQLDYIFNALLAQHGE